MELSSLKKIILIGCDGVGKTTIATNHAKSNGIEYIKCSGVDGNDKIALATKMLDDTKTKSAFIMDRFYFPDDLIYSFIHNNEPMDISKWRDVVNEIIKQDITIVYVYDSLDNITARFNARGDEFVDSSQLESIVNAYESIIPVIEQHVRVLKVNVKELKEFIHG